MENNQQKTAIEIEIEQELTEVARKPFVLHDFDTPRDKEMAVFTAAKKLSEYIRGKLPSNSDTKTRFCCKMFIRTSGRRTIRR